MTLQVRNAQNTLEQTLATVIRFALGARLGTVASIAALRAVSTRGASTTQRKDGDLITIVGGTTSLWQWSQESTATDDGATVIQPTDVTANGRWLIQTSPVYFVPALGGDSYPLDQLPYQTQQYQPLRTVVVLDKRFTPEEIVQLCFGQTPAVVISAEGDTPQRATPYAQYLNEYTFTISVVAENLRDMRQAQQGSQVPGEIIPGANTIDAMLWELLVGAGDGRLTEMVDGIRDVQPGQCENWESKLAQRFVIRSRWYHILATVEMLQAPNEMVEMELVAAQAAMTDLGLQAAIDPDNLVTLGLGVSLTSGFAKPVAAGTAQIDGATVTYAGQLYTFPATMDTYRDLNPDGTMSFNSVAVGAPGPTLATGSLRIAVTTTDGSGVVSDIWIAARQVPYMNPYQTSLQ